MSSPTDNLKTAREFLKVALSASRGLDHQRAVQAIQGADIQIVYAENDVTMASNLAAGAVKSTARLFDLLKEIVEAYHDLMAEADEKARECIASFLDDKILEARDVLGYGEDAVGGKYTAIDLEEPEDEEGDLN